MDSSSQFRRDVIRGLGQQPKRLSSAYFYDEKGDALFKEIMQLEEYYLPGCETDILNRHSGDIAREISSVCSSVEIVELGSGDGSKTRILLKEFESQIPDVKYVPLDISESILEENEANVGIHAGGVEVDTVSGNYFRTYPCLVREKQQRLVLFLGGNIGNYILGEALNFIQLIKEGLEPDDHLIIAFDLVKDPRTIIRAYDDSKGITRLFNLNLLVRINRELGGNFNLQNFDHYPYYNPVNGLTHSYLISLKKQTVEIAGTEPFEFEKYEAIHTEVSKKYFSGEIEYLGRESGLDIVKWYYDRNKMYALVLMKRM